MSRSARSDDAALEVFLALSEPMLAAVRIAQQPEVRPEAARTLFDEQLRALRSAAERRRLPLAHVDDVVYALAAHADEAMIARPGTREAWLPRLLQLSLFGENSAGDGFFVRLDGVRRDPSRARVLAVYYVVLALGFRGRYASRDAARLELIEEVHLDLVRAGAATERPLAPSALPRRAAEARSIDARWALALGAGAWLLAGASWALLALELAFHTALVLG